MNGETGLGPANASGEPPLVVRRAVIITNPQGLHLRPATTFAQRARAFAGQVNVIRDGKRVNGKSQFELLLLAAEPGTEVVVEVAGDAAGDALEDLVEALAASYDDEE